MSAKPCHVRVGDVWELIDLHLVLEVKAARWAAKERVRYAECLTLRLDGPRAGEVRLSCIEEPSGDWELVWRMEP